MKTITIRMYFETFKKLRQNFPADYNESAAHYFERIAKWFEEHGII
jgi:CMP-N-acetylneuraminic acid synthetase